MKKVYPVIITEVSDDDNIPYLVYVPDYDAMTQGETLIDAIEMAEDIISIKGLEKEESPSRLEDIKVESSPFHDEKNIVGEIKTLVTVDFDMYKKKLGNKSVRINVTLPSWLNYEVDRANINVSAVLQEVSRHQLNLNK